MTRYTLVVGTRNWSSWSLRPFVALKATGAPCEIVDIRLRQFDSHRTRANHHQTPRQRSQFEDALIRQNSFGEICHPRPAASRDHEKP